MTYNTAQDVDNAMWMNFNDDSFWSLKFVIPVNYGAKTFSCSDLKCNDADDAPNITVTDGRVLLGKGHNLHGLWHQFYNSPFNYLALLQIAAWLHPEDYADVNVQQEWAEAQEKYSPVPGDGTFFSTN